MTLTNHILVIGGSGFIGQHIVQQLLANGTKCSVLSRQPVAKKTPIQNTLHQAGHYLGDWRNPNTLRNVLLQARKSTPFSHIIQLACSSLPHSSNLNPHEDIQSNLVPMLTLLDLCIEFDIKKILFASSGGTVYGPSTAPYLTETDPTNPICSYGITKLAIEKYLAIYQRVDKLAYAALRIANPFGAGQNPSKPQGAIAVFMHKIMHNQPIEVWGDGSVVRDYIAVEDVAKAFICAITSENSGIYNIASGQGLALTDIITALEDTCGKTATVHYQPARNVDISKVILNCSKAKQELNWTPDYQFEDALCAMFQKLHRPINTGV